jgi:hypothetical protein
MIAGVCARLVFSSSARAGAARPNSASSASARNPKRCRMNTQQIMFLPAAAPLRAPHIFLSDHSGWEIY